MKRVMVFIEESTHRGLKVKAALSCIPMRDLIREILTDWVVDIEENEKKACGNGDRVAPEGR